MAATAFQKQYRQEFIAGYEQRQSLLRDAVTTEAVISGNEAEFLVADSGSASTVTRGVNGKIPARNDNLSQNTATLTEEHDLVQKTGFNVFASQSDQRRIMQETTMGTVNRKIDDQIITQLNTGTVDTGAAAVITLRIITSVKATLGNASVPFDGGICLLMTPAMEGYLSELPSFSSADYVSKSPLETGETLWDDTQGGFYLWQGMKLIVHPNLPGVGTNAEKCFAFHKSAIGHALNTGGIDSTVGYDDEQDYSYARTTVYCGAKMLQNSGVVVINHDGSALQLS